MIPNTEFLLELKPTQKSLSILGENSSVVKTTNKFIATVPQTQQCQCNLCKAHVLLLNHVNPGVSISGEKSSVVKTTNKFTVTVLYHTTMSM